MAASARTRVDTYIANQPAEARATLQRVRRIIRKALPDAEETVSYRILAYKQRGRSIVYLAGWKRHWSLYPMTATARAAVGPEIEPYVFDKGTVRFPLGERVPVKLVERIVRELAKAAESRHGRGGGGESGPI